MDPELKKAFTEMQVNKIESTKKIRLLHMKTDSLKLSKQRIEVTNRHISSLEPDTRVYASVGRMYVLNDIPTLTEHLQTTQASYEEMIAQCEKNKDFLIKNLKEQEESLRELVQQKKAETTETNGKSAE
ncbi:prefoldin subunit 1 [Anopheles maculipalpis]|uniref:prefoldin subunit 1 n=1 Tax=Anopheles maculipalpis TaxID=1496333 RepID=UPI0021592571|nr:prefoldin subunit 1 [Anopheles maculipalpis]